MLETSSITTVAHVIELAVAPVFLLSGIGAMLAVMTNRLSRIVDRARRVEARLGGDGADDPAIRAELRVLVRRARLISLSIGLCTSTALLISGVIVSLFLSAFLRFDAALLVSLLFIAAMLAFIVALLCFLREVLLATAGLRFGRPG
ncbi:MULTISPECIES: DUF2721 domain-containing protein [unclassified Marichromatium]|uniref:DUF2721 domain-containing protein n=1 Tax=unclassified Marichromatium TaxID=2618417 RepID=UPI000F3ABC51|nr:MULTISPECIES: DUF2721 domain-containing protein [unclassified Marichromatium]MBO8085559.1 DUF2721 domain-containing protein [Marichromatium sp.]RNE91531.1 DUF2721 domain-containing protein [Marichromatium sp. AB31]RNE92533.1 DUF2721 domain-containing protein [Marichromatium sp. AB32]